MKTKEMIIDISEFSEKCVKILENLPEAGILILKQGKPLARIASVRKQLKPLDLHGSMKGKIKIKGNILRASSK